MAIYLIFLIVGGILLPTAVLNLRGRLAFLKTGERAVGTVVELIEDKDDGSIVYYPVFEIPTRYDGKLTYRHGTASSKPEWEMGETVEFIFEPGKPDTVRILKYWRIFGWSLSLLAVVVDLLLIGGGYFLLSGYFEA